MVGWERLEGIHVGRTSSEMHHHDGARARRNGGFGGLSGEIERLRIDIGEDRRRVAKEHGRGGSDEGEWRHNHLVARTHAKRAQGYFERNGSVAAADRVRHPLTPAPLPFHFLAPPFISPP